MEPDRLEFFRNLLNERLRALLSEAGATLGDLIVEKLGDKVENLPVNKEEDLQ